MGCGIFDKSHHDFADSVPIGGNIDSVQETMFVVMDTKCDAMDTAGLVVELIG